MYNTSLIFLHPIPQFGLHNSINSMMIFEVKLEREVFDFHILLSHIQLVIKLSQFFIGKFSFTHRFIFISTGETNQMLSTSLHSLSLSLAQKSNHSKVRDTCHWWASPSLTSSLPLLPLPSFPVPAGLQSPTQAHFLELRIPSLPLTS